MSVDRFYQKSTLCSRYRRSGCKKKYLLNPKVISSDAARTYKVSRPYQPKQFVHSVKFCECPEMVTFCVISALCKSSQLTNAEEVKVVFAILGKITGVPYRGLCSCTVGFSLTCGDIGATLFRLCDLVTSSHTPHASVLPCCLGFVFSKILSKPLTCPSIGFVITRQSSSWRPLIGVQCRKVHYINTTSNSQRSSHLCWWKQQRCWQFSQEHYLHRDIHNTSNLFS